MPGQNSRPDRDKWVTRYSKAAERKFLFYATLGMLILWGCLKLIRG